MTDKIKYTVTIEVEADAVGPAQAIRQALDWARDTESGPGVVTVRAGNLSPLRAAVADGRVAQLFTGPVEPGPICQKPAGLAKWRFDELADKWLGLAGVPHLCGVACPETLKIAGHELQRVTREAAEAASGPVHTGVDPAGVDPAGVDPAGVDPAGGPDSTAYATIRQGVSFRAVEDIADRMQKQARKEIRAAFPHAVRAKKVASSLYDYGSELLRLDPGEDEEAAKPAGVDPDRLRELANDWRQVARNLGMRNAAFDQLKDAALRADIQRLQKCIVELEELTDDR